MKTDNELQQKQKELKEEITKRIDNTIPACFYNLIGDALARIFRHKKRPHWTVSAVVLFVVIYLPATLVSVLTGEVYKWETTHFFYVVLAVAIFSAPTVNHINITANVLSGLRDNVVDAIQDVKSLNAFSEWLSAFSVRKWLIFNLVFGLPYYLIWTFGESLFVGKFVGLGVAVFNLVIFYYDSVFYTIFKMLTLPSLLSELNLNIYEPDPGNSKVIKYLIYMLNVYVYYYVSVVAFITAIMSFFQASWMLWLILIMGWLPSIAQFIANQYAVRKIIITAKWNKLEELQGQIKELHTGNLKDAPEATIVRINQLMDLHDRISGKPNSMLNWNTGLNLLNQLMLPLLGVLLGNIDKVINMLFKP